MTAVNDFLVAGLEQVRKRYTHTNLDSKRSAVAKLESFRDILVAPCTEMQQSIPKVSPIIPLKAVASYT
jgi:hypothetical protein